MNRLISKMFGAFSPSKPIFFIEIERNEKCFCNSGKKYKVCHLPELKKKGKIALYAIDENLQRKSVKIVSKRKSRKLTIRFNASLKGDNYSVGENIRG